MGHTKSSFQRENNIVQIKRKQIKTKKQKLAKLTKELEELETKHKKDTNPNIALQLKEIRKEIICTLK